MTKYFIKETVTTTYVYIIDASSEEQAYDIFNEATDRSDANYVENSEPKVVVEVKE